MIYQKSLDIYLSVLSHNHLDAAAVYNKIANVYYDQSIYNEAFLMYQNRYISANQFLIIIILMLVAYIYTKYIQVGHNYLDVAALYNNIASIYSNFQSKYDNHYDVANSYNSIGYINCHLGNYDKALSMHQKSLDIYLLVFGHNNTDVGCNMLVQR